MYIYPTHFEKVLRIVRFLAKKSKQFFGFIFSGKANSMIFSAVFVISVVVIVNAVSNYYTKTTNTRNTINNTKMVLELEVLRHAALLEKINADTMATINKRTLEATIELKSKELAANAKNKQKELLGAAEKNMHQVRLEEAKAAMNPYVAAANYSDSHIKSYLDESQTNYVIETPTGVIHVPYKSIVVNGIRYTPEQRKLMGIAYLIGMEFDFPETMQALLLQESSAGQAGRIGDTSLKMGKRSYGVMQVKVATARKVMRKFQSIVPKYFPTRKYYKRLRDEEIIIKLIQDDEFGIRIAALNFTIHRANSRNWAHAVVAYNRGQRGANKIADVKKHKYYRKIVQRLIKSVRPFNAKTGFPVK